MIFSEIIKEELNTQFINKELSGLETIKKQLDAKIVANPMIAKELAAPVGEIEKKITALKYSIAEYDKNRKTNNTGIGTQKQITKPPIQAPVTPPSTEPATATKVKQAVPSS